MLRNAEALSDEELLAVYDEADVEAAKVIPVRDLEAHLRNRGVPDDYIDVCFTRIYRTSAE